MKKIFILVFIAIALALFIMGGILCNWNIGEILTSKVACLVYCVTAVAVIVYFGNRIMKKW